MDKVYCRRCAYELETGTADGYQRHQTVEHCLAAADKEYDRLRELVMALPVVEGKITVERDCSGGYTVYYGDKKWQSVFVSGVSRSEADALAKLLTARQEMR